MTTKYTIIDKEKEFQKRLEILKIEQSRLRQNPEKQKSNNK